MINAKNKKILLCLLVTFSLIYLQNSHAELSQDSKDAIKIARALTVLTKFGFAIAANVQELKENELASLKLETTYLCLDIADTTLKILEDSEKVSLIEEGVGIYHLIKIFQNIKAIYSKKADAAKNKNPSNSNKKNPKLAKKIIYSIFKYLALAGDTSASLALFNFEDAETRILASNLCGFSKVLSDLIDNATPEIRSKVILVLSPFAFLLSTAIGLDQEHTRRFLIEEEKRKQQRLKEEKEEEERKQKQEEENKKYWEDFRKKEEAQRQKEKEEEERRQKEKEEQERNWWNNLSEEEKKQEQERRKRKEKQEENERKFDNNFRTSQRQKKEKFWKNIKEKWEKLKRKKREDNTFSSFSIPTFSQYKSNFAQAQRPFTNQFEFKNPFNTYHSPFDSFQSPFDTYRNPFVSHQSSFWPPQDSFYPFRKSYTDPFDYTYIDPETFLDTNSSDLGSKDLSDNENEQFWNNVKKQWNDFKEQQEQETHSFHEQQRARKEAYQKEETRRKEKFQREKSKKNFFEDFFSGFASNIPASPFTFQAPSYYEIIGVDKNATQQEISKAYRKLIQKFHPDKNPSKEAVNVTKFLNEIKDTLTDSDKRRNYDNNPNGPKVQKPSQTILDFIKDAKSK